MELLLNLAWMLLVLPAFWLWRRGEAARARCSVTPLQFFLALACAVVVLFPVISATDDLHAMQAEMEESASSKRAVRQASSEKSPPAVNRLQGPAALTPNLSWGWVPQSGFVRVFASSETSVSRPHNAWTVRGPPSSYLA